MTLSTHEAIALVQQMIDDTSKKVPLSSSLAELLLANRKELKSVKIRGEFVVVSGPELVQTMQFLKRELEILKLQ